MKELPEVKQVRPYVAAELEKKAKIYEERNKLYGDNYKRHGLVMQALFPYGLAVTNVENHNRLGVFTQMVAKLTRYAENFQRGGHDDSLDDLTVYTMMLKELDMEAASMAEYHGYEEAAQAATNEPEVQAREADSFLGRYPDPTAADAFVYGRTVVRPGAGEDSEQVAPEPPALDQLEHNSDAPPAVLEVPQK